MFAQYISLPHGDRCHVLLLLPTSCCLFSALTVLLSCCLSFRIYLLNLFLAFLQPKFDPALAADLAESEVEEGAPGLPTSMPSPVPGRDAYGELQDGEFRPFIRRLPEFKFWYAPSISHWTEKTTLADLISSLPFLYLRFFRFETIGTRRRKQSPSY